ncbi:hypothetical protein KM043_011218 [Ampulex compressa]|nr:hypothetical protein KM043_011218 [Ampulex compressa]
MNWAWKDLDYTPCKMRRTLLNPLDHEDLDESIDTTPLRAGSIRFPRLRLLDKDPKSERQRKNVLSHWFAMISYERPIWDMF